jgi:hypothetical protein
MRYTHEMIAQKNSPRYDAARQILDDILNKRIPNLDVLTTLYGKDIANDVINTINKFYDDADFFGGILRKHINNAPTILSDMRKLVDADKDFRAMDVYFSQQISRTESTDILIKEISSEIGDNIHNKFGPYSSHITRATALAMHYKLKRKCNISIICHWVGAAGLMHFLQITDNIPKSDDPYYLTTVAFLHDFKEDLPRSVIHDDGSPYGFYRTEEFSSDYLPHNERMVKDLNILTNLYGNLSKYAYEYFKKQGQTFTIERFKELLQKYIQTDNNPKSLMFKVHEHMLILLSDKQYEGIQGKDLLNAVSWDFYESYVNRILDKSKTAIIVKCCDQSYNFIGKDPLSHEDLTKVLLKMWLWASDLYGRGFNLKYLDNFVEELLEDTLCYAEYYIIKDLMRTEAVIPFYAATFQKIKALSPILYIDKRLNHS